MRFCFLLCVAMGLWAFVPVGKKKKLRSVEAIEVPGVQQINAGLYIDRTEVTNFHWMEFLAWTQKVYGRNSAEYTGALPDTSLWLRESGIQQHLAEHYLRHPAYRDYPVVGVSYSQMAAYCKWRSDRVMEYALIRTGAFVYDTAPTPQTFFSTEKYLAGRYLNVVRDPSVKAVPQFSLPTREEWRQAEAYSRSIYENLSERRRRKGPDAFYAAFISDEKVVPVMPDRPYRIAGALYNLNRNVSEQLADSTREAGSNWKQHALPEEEEGTRYTSGASVTKGFRCAFRWKKL